MKTFGFSSCFTISGYAMKNFVLPGNMCPVLTGINSRWFLKSFSIFAQGESWSKNYVPRKCWPKRLWPEFFLFLGTLPLRITFNSFPNLLQEKDFFVLIESEISSLIINWFECRVKHFHQPILQKIFILDTSRNLF